jgi:hypothetical protein
MTPNLQIWSTICQQIIKRCLKFLSRNFRHCIFHEMAAAWAYPPTVLLSRVRLHCIALDTHSSSVLYVTDV